MHPDKFIRESLEYAKSIGWRVVKAGPRAAHLGDNLLSRVES